jgi:hypothetical protein
VTITIKLTPITCFLILAIIAIGLALGLSPDPHAVRQLHTSAGAYRLAIAALLIPYVLIWYASFYTFGKLRDYSEPLKGTKDGAAFQKITVAMGVLAFSLVIPTILSLILNNIAAHHESFKAASVIIDNYLGLFPGLLAFLLLYNGARMLRRTASRGRAQKLDLRWHAPWFLLLSVLFSHLTIDNYYRSHPYHLTLWLLIVTFIVPYLYGWVVGLLSAYDLWLYAKAVPGLLYKRAIRLFASGITVVILGSIAIQFVSITITQRLSDSLGAVLLIDYGLLIIVTIGLFLMAFGTKQLQKIEEV